MQCEICSFGAEEAPNDVQNAPIYVHAHKVWSRKPGLTKKVDNHIRDTNDIWLWL